MARYKPYTDKLSERYDSGIPFRVFSFIYLCLLINYTIVYYPENIKVNGLIISTVLYIESFFWFGMSYFAFYKATFSDAGEPRDNYKHPVPFTDPEEFKAKSRRGEKVYDIYTKIIMHMGDKAIRRGYNLDDTMTYDQEIGYEEQVLSRKDLVTCNAIMNAFDYKHCKR